ncbi:ABC transporter ATP-binding protein [Synechococcus sp. H65.1]|uniref:ABC transporter ATP-binding protein n=1 Tax=unclassified Synechococcus TaxID=2626047 RepID=UPI0039C44053
MLEPQPWAARRQGPGGSLERAANALIPPRPPVVQMVGINKVYPLPEGSFQALYDINLTIWPGEYCAIMGPSGSGKSTLMNLMGCLDRPSSGRYWLDGIEVSTLTDQELARIRNQKIGFVFQQFHLLPVLTALENVMLPLAYAGVPEPEQRRRAKQALEQVGLGSKLHQRPAQLSGGQQQRVAIARAIVNRPQLLLADEPTGALDSQTGQEVLNLFAELHHQGITLVVVTHDLAVAQAAQRLIRMGDGRLLP